MAEDRGQSTVLNGAAPPGVGPASGSGTVAAAPDAPTASAAPAAPDVPTAPAAEQDLLASLDALLSIATFYPVGHDRCRALADDFLVRMRDLLAGRPTLQIDAGLDQLGIQGRAVEISGPVARRLHDVLGTLCLGRIQIDAEVSPVDLHAFATRLLQDRHRAEVSTGIRQFDYQDLPPAIRVQQREFGFWSGVDVAGLRAEEVQAAVGRTMASLDQLELAPERRELWREQIEKVFARLAERLERRRAGLAGDGQRFERPLEEVLELGVHAIQLAMTDLFSSGAEIGNLQGMFEVAEQAVALSDDRQSVEVMTEILREVSTENAREQRRHPEHLAPEGIGCEMSVAALRERLHALLQGHPPPAELAPRDRRERIAVTLQMLLDDPDPAAATVLTRELDALLSQPLEPPEQHLLYSAVRGFLAAGDRRTADILLPRILRPLRRAPGQASAEFLLAVHRGDDPEACEVLWPHLVNQILLGAGRGEPETATRLYALAAGLNQGRMASALLRLERLEALQGASWDRQLLAAPDPAFYPVFSMLLGSSRGDAIGAQLLRGLQRRPVACPGAESLMLLDGYHSGLKPFLQHLLVDVAENRPPRANVRRTACQILVRGLPALGPEQRDEPWVPAAIHSLGALGCAEAFPVLREIRSARRMLIWRQWPRPCREAAAEAERRLAAGGTMAENRKGE